MSLIKRVGRAVNAAVGGMGAQTFRAKGEAIVCPVCGRGEFVQAPGDHYAKPSLLWMNLPWLKLDRMTTSLICTHCTHILTFGRVPEVADDDLP